MRNLAKNRKFNSSILVGLKIKETQTKGKKPSWRAKYPWKFNIFAMGTHKSHFWMKNMKNLTLHFLPKSFYLWIDLTKRARNDPNRPQNLWKPTYYIENSWNYWLQATNLKNSYLGQKCIIYSLYKIKFLWIPLLNANVAYEWPLRGSRMNCASFENMKIT